MELDLDSTTQGTFFLPSRKRKRALAQTADTPPLALDAWKKAAYDRSWGKHQARINDTLKRLAKRSSDQLVAWVNETYPSGEQSTPFASIPTALVSSSSIQTLHTLIATVEQLLDERHQAAKGKGKAPASSSTEDVDMDGDGQTAQVPEMRRTVVECKNGTSLDTLVESIVLGLLTDELEPGSLPTLPSLLRFKDTETKLCITLHQIHLLPLRTLTSLLSVFTRYSPRLNLVLVLTTASAPGVLCEVVPAAVMEALDMRVFEGIEGGDVWEEVVKDLYFSSWAPEVMIDGKTFDELRDTFERNTHSVECLISSLQYIHMKSFFGPLGQFIPAPQPVKEGVPREPELIPPEQEQATFKRLLSLNSVLHSSLAKRNPAFRPPPELLLEDVEIDASSQLDASVFPRALVDGSHKAVHKHAADRRLAFVLLASVRNYLACRRDDSGVVGSGVQRVRGPEAIRIMRAVVDGDAAGTDRGWVWTTKLVSKLPTSELPKLTSSIMGGVKASGYSFMQQAGLSADLNKARDSPSQMSALLEHMFRRWITPHEDVLFHELYYFQGLKDLVKVFRPAPLEALQTALLSPQTYLGTASCDPTEPMTLPDTTLLFLRYLESGKMINLYDWFEAFSSTLRVPPPSDKDTDAQVEKRKEVQARFMRAFHELDFLGLLKGTKRKQDHVLKTFFMLGEDEADGVLADSATARKAARKEVREVVLDA